MRILVIRTSAMGDVALTTPVLAGMKIQHPEVEIIVLTRHSFGPFFNEGKNLKLFFPDFKKQHKGIPGIIQLFKELTHRYEIDYVIDLHDVLRSQLLRFLFRLKGVKVAVIDKGRREKNDVITGKKKVITKHSVERYCDVFAKAGFPVTETEGPWIVPSQESLAKADKMLHHHPGCLIIGVAPYAKHKLKMWPEENMISLLQMIFEKYKVKFLFFGGKEDAESLSILQSKIPESVNLAGTLSLDEEMAFMKRLDLMIAMDSSNMHIAALIGTKTISLWGGTDPLTGFSAWKQPEEYSIRIPMEELTCRPCTIYGKGECRRKDFACMKQLTPEIVFRKIENLGVLKNQK